MDSGKHVLCEKPLACNSKEVKQIIDKAKQTKVFFMEAFWSRCFPAWLHFRDLINSKKYGDVQMCHSNFGIQMV